MKTFEELEKYLSGIVTKNTKEIEECKANIQKADAAIAKADGELLEAEKVVNVSAYNKAKDAIWSATHAKELYTKQLTKLTTEPLITEKEYKSLLKSIKDVADNTHEVFNDEAIEPILKIKEIAERATAVDTKADELIRIAQYDVLKDSNDHWAHADKYKAQGPTVSSFFYYKIEGSSLGDRAGIKEIPQRNIQWGA